MTQEGIRATMNKITPYSKAIAAVLTPVLISILLGLAKQYDLGISPELAGQIAVVIVAGVTGLVVYKVPNKPPNK